MTLREILAVVLFVLLDVAITAGFVALVIVVARRRAAVIEGTTDPEARTDAPTVPPITPLNTIRRQLRDEQQRQRSARDASHLN